ncbi:MAG TPA: hypothetical protein VK194_02490 [Candidatus Deferrimicrobium sp.]|nr:hypothetical protein [Candidatus Deferrimicrobium sp.]
MIRRLALLPIALVAVLSLVLAACGSTPAAPALTNPKEIVTRGVTSLEGVKSVEFTGTFSGSLKAAQIGSFDLSTIKMAGALDMANKTAKFNLDAPTLLGTKVDALVVGGAAYYKLSGAIAQFAGGAADKYTKVPVPTASADPFAAATDMTKLVAQLQDGLAKLPSPLTKGADEKCGDVDCYRVSTTVTAAQLKALDASQTVDGDVTVDLWTRKSDYRPAKLGVTLTSATLGSFGMTLDLRYDVTVSVAAPPADQVAP